MAASIPNLERAYMVAAMETSMQILLPASFTNMSERFIAIATVLVGSRQNFHAMSGQKTPITAVSFCTLVPQAQLAS